MEHRVASPRPASQCVRQGRVRARRTTVASYLLGLLFMSALAIAVAQFAQIERFVALAGRIEPGWLALGVVLQFGTYLCESTACKLVLARGGYPLALRQLLPLGVAKLFANQAMPSAGVSGNVFFLAALRRRGVPSVHAMACILADAASYYAAYAAMAACALAALAWRGQASPWLLAAALPLVALQAAVPGLLWYTKRRGGAPAAVHRFRQRHLRAWLRMLRRTAALLPLERSLFVRTALLHAAIMVLDAATLWAMLRGLGQAAPFAAAFSSFVLASMAMSVSPVPLGLGTFEAACVAMLHGAGIGVEAALMATILLRGATTWLPMLPGMLLIRRELRGRPVPPGPRGRDAGG